MRRVLLCTETNAAPAASASTISGTITRNTTTVANLGGAHRPDDGGGHGGRRPVAVDPVDVGSDVERRELRRQQRCAGEVTGAVTQPAIELGRRHVEQDEHRV